jgi:hypothetical protein
MVQLPIYMTATSFIMGAGGIGASFFMVLMGWAPWWLLFGTLVYAAVLYESTLFATGIVGGFASGVFAIIGWLPLLAYFTPLIVATVFLAVKVASKYVNTGATQ